MTLARRLEAIARAHPDAPCVLGPDGLSWHAFWAESAGWAGAFSPHAGRVVALSAPDGPLLAAMLVGALRAGAWALPLPAGATPSETERLLAGLDVGLVATAQTPPGEAVAATPEGGGLVIGTSGTTGTPKRVALEAAGLAWNAAAHADSLGLPEGVRSLMLAPMHHAFPLVAVLFASWLRGGAVGWLGGPFTPRGFLKRVEADAIGYAAVAPTLLRLLMARAPQGAAWPSVLSVGAAPMGPDALVEASAWAAEHGCRLYHTYGLTEAGPRVSTLAPEAIAAHAGSVGRPLDGVAVRVVRDGRACEAHVPGEVWVRSPGVMAGYLPDYEGLEPDGWLTTGDWGYLDADGYLHLTGRLKEIIVTGGTNVSPREIELALEADPRVAEAAVTGVPDRDYGEVARAWVVLSAPATPHDLLVALSQRLSRSKLPHRIVIADQLPRTALGKVDKQRLKEVACEA